MGKLRDLSPILFLLVASIVMAVLFIETGVGILLDIDVFGFAHDHAFAWGLLLTALICLLISAVLSIYIVEVTTKQEDEERG